jgi:hypothetical protein
VGSDFELIDRGDFLAPVVNSVVVELVGLGGEVDSILGEFVVDLGECAPVGSLPCASQVLIGNNTNVDLFNWELELIHEHVNVGLVDGLLLVLVDADQGESDSLDVELVNSG